MKWLSIYLKFLKILLCLLDAHILASGEVSSIILPEEIKVEEGASVQFKCLSTADTFKTYWTLQNNTLPGSHIKIDGSVLKIGVVSKTDRGIYVCHTKTSGREHQATARLIVTDKTVALVSPTILTTEEGQLAEIKCLGIGENTSIHWTTDQDKELPTRASVVRGKLQWLSITKRDEGFYVCKVASSTGKSQARVKVEVKKKSEAEVIPEVLEVEEGQTAQFICRVIGDRPRVYWTTDENEPLPHHASVNGPVLVLGDVSKHDMKAYICKAYTLTGRASGSAKLIVRQRTRAFITPKSKAVYSGDPVEFHCLGIGHMATVEWKLPHWSYIPSHVKMKGSVLKIKSASMRDAGDYVCLVNSTTGFAQDIGKLIIKEKQHESLVVNNVGLGIFAHRKAKVNLQEQDADDRSNQPGKLGSLRHNSPPLHVKLLLVGSIVMVAIGAYIVGFLIYKKLSPKTGRIMRTSSLTPKLQHFYTRYFERYFRQPSNAVHPLPASDLPSLSSESMKYSVNNSPAVSPKISMLTTTRPSPSSNGVVHPVPFAAPTCDSYTQTSPQPGTLTMTDDSPGIPPASLTLSHTFPRPSSPVSQLGTPKTDLKPSCAIIDAKSSNAAAAEMKIALSKIWSHSTQPEKDSVMTRRPASNHSSEQPVAVSMGNSKSQQASNVSRKYGYLGFSPQGIYRGYFEIRSNTDDIPTLSYLALEKLKSFAVSSTSSGLALVPSSLRISSTLIKRGKVEYVRSRELKSSASVSKLSTESLTEIRSDLTRSKSSSNVTNTRPSLELKGRRSYRRNKASLLRVSPCESHSAVWAQPSYGKFNFSVTSTSTLPSNSYLTRTGIRRAVAPGSIYARITNFAKNNNANY